MSNYAIKRSTFFIFYSFICDCCGRTWLALGTKYKGF